MAGYPIGDIAFEPETRTEVVAGDLGGRNGDPSLQVDTLSGWIHPVLSGQRGPDENE